MIALFTIGFGGGGAEQVFVSLANYWSDAGYDVGFWVIKEKGPLRSRLKSSIPVTVLGAGPRFIQRGRLIARLAERVETMKPDILFSTLTYANCIAGGAAKRVSVPTRFVLREANSFENLQKAGFLRYQTNLFSMRRSYPQADAIIVNAHQVGKDLKNKIVGDGVPIHLIPNPVALDDSKAVSPKVVERSKATFRIIGCGRLISQKGFSDLIEAFSMLMTERAGRRHELVILGEGPLHGELLEKATALGLGDRVQFPGFVDNVRDWYRSADLFVLSSHWEGFPNALVEAMACGVPVVSTDCPGASGDILSPELKDYLSPVGNPKGLAEKMNAALSHYPSKETIVGIIERRFSFATIAETYLACVEAPGE